ncbi:MAG: UDP-N-acetylmuramate dehydrogenase [Nitrospirota bacterium]
MKNEEYRNIFAGELFEGEVRFMEPMSSHTSLRIGGPADILAVPKDFDSLKNIHLNLIKNRIPYVTLGSGTNVLIMDGGIEGAVVSLRSLKKIDITHESDEFVDIYAEAGALLPKLVLFARERYYSGIEGLAGIPGTFGGAICGNSGAFGYEIKDVVLSVEIMDKAGKVSRRNREEMSFGYRRSGIAHDEFIVGALMRLRKERSGEVSKRVDDFLRMKKERQPIREVSAGCVFKNPAGKPAGRLLDEAGCKGAKIGDVEVSEVHANFFINKGRANASDFLKLMELVSRRVERKFGITLEPEIRILGRAIAD